MTASHCGASRRDRDATQSRRLLALAEVYDGGSRTDASRIGGVGLQIFATGCCASTPADRTGWSMGSHRAHPRSSTPITAAHWRRLLRPARSRRSTASCAGGARTWRGGSWRRSPSRSTRPRSGARLKALGFAKISARPRHYAQNELAVEAFKKNFPAELAKIRARLPKGVEIELWWQDEARIGQKNKLTRRWARRGTRPRAPRDQRTEWAYIFGAICPAKGKGAGLSHALVRHRRHGGAPHRDQCRRRSRRPCGADRRSGRLALDAQAGDPLSNITVLALPPRSPELNPVENVWQFMRDNWLSRIFKSYEDIVALCCQVEQPHRPTMEDHVPRHAQMGAGF